MSSHVWKAGTMLAGLFVAAGVSAAPAQAQDDGVETVVVTAKKLSEARSGIEPQTGASAYNITSANIQAQPGG
jgi:hypothetical protein